MCKCEDVPYPTPVDRLYIGSVGACSDALRHGITVIVSVSTLDLINKYPKITYLFAKLADDDSNIVHAIKPLLGQIRYFLSNPKHKVMVRCEDGHNRSAATIIAFMMKNHRVRLQPTFELMKKIKPCIQPCDSFMIQLAIFEANLFKKKRLSSKSKTSLKNVQL
jgi:protein-tyrosine phosphatase